MFLFFFSRLGGSAVERAIAYQPEVPAWKWLYKFHRFAEFALVVAVPITHLALLTLAASGAPFLIDKLFGAGAAPIVFKLLIAAVSFSIAAYFVYRRCCKTLYVQTWSWLYFVVLLVAAYFLFITQSIANDYRSLVCSSG